MPARRNLWPIIVVVGLVAIAAIAAALYFALRGNGSNSSSASTGSAARAAVNPLNALPGIQKTKAPWAPEYAHLNDRLTPLKLDANPQEVLNYHIHQHLDIFVNGKKITVPQFIGINDSSYITELHTHAPDGIIHVEAPSNRHYTLGDFFAEWGVFLNNKCVGGYCQGYHWYINGKRQTGSPFLHQLQPHEEIVFAIGRPPAKIPSTYDWTGL